MTDTPSRKRQERDFPEDSLGNTDDLCRAVKRLHTSSSGSISVSISKYSGPEVSQDEACSPALPLDRREEKSLTSLPTRIESDANEHRAIKGDRFLPPSRFLTEAQFKPRELPKLNLPDLLLPVESADSVEHPLTPGKEEHSSPVQNKGQRLGTKEELIDQGRLYDDLYEEANNLLNNLHFERIHRTATK